jgi:adenine C2-methylase RlmN of 23S rRNA A2503 and tRNA A37
LSLIFFKGEFTYPDKFQKWSVNQYRSKLGLVNQETNEQLGNSLATKNNESRIHASKQKVLTLIKKSNPVKIVDIFIDFIQNSNLKLKDVNELIKSLEGKSSSANMKSNNEINETDVDKSLPIAPPIVIPPSNGPVDENMFQDEDILDEVMDSQRSRT